MIALFHIYAKMMGDVILLQDINPTRFVSMQLVAKIFQIVVLLRNVLPIAFACDVKMIQNVMVGNDVPMVIA
jgi:hypothetical protein